MAKKKTFEESLAQLEEIVKEMESGRLPLDKALKIFEEGMKCSRLCQNRLDETEKKVRLLMADEGGNIKEKTFEQE